MHSCFFSLLLLLLLLLIRITLLLVDPLEAAADASGAMQKVEVPCYAPAYDFLFLLSLTFGGGDSAQVDIGQTAYANAQEFYAEAKRRAHKHAKTVASSQMAVKVPKFSTTRFASPPPPPSPRAFGRC